MGNTSFYPCFKKKDIGFPYYLFWALLYREFGTLGIMMIYGKIANSKVPKIEFLRIIKNTGG
ncbi:MAG: hypothetical protein K9M75_10425 [Phycisphaerae bacterium]|nr:hypothetical protein [Phycisphaerae bacterium]